MSSGSITAIPWELQEVQRTLRTVCALFILLKWCAPFIKHYVEYSFSIKLPNLSVFTSAL